MLIFTAPGQGAQTPGFLSPWLELPGLADQLGAWSELAGRDLIRLGTTGSAEEITDTSVAQPLLVAAALAVAGLLGEPDVAAGHSVGELAAGAIAGVLSAEDAIKLTRVRGEAMAAACDAVPTGMTAVLGGDEDTVLAAIADAGLTPANINTAGQIVAGGTLEQLAAVRGEPAGRGAAAAAARGRARSTPGTWPRRSTRSPRRPRAPPSRTRRSRCCPTATARSSPPGPTGWSGSSARSRTRSAGTSAWRRWPASGSPR